MIDYSKDIHALNIPWIESPFFQALVQNLQATDAERELAREMHEKGYVIIDLNLSDEYLDGLNRQIDKLAQSEKIKTNTSYFSYNEHPRIVDAGKSVPQVVELATHPNIIQSLEFLYGREAIPFGTINFTHGSEQPLHSDSMHFGTVPAGFLAASWVALEDIDTENGALRVVEGSHKFRNVDVSYLNLRPPRNLKESEANYRVYEEYIIELIQSQNYSETLVEMKSGQALIWAANLLHGGSEIKNKRRTRKSLVTHYHFSGCRKYYIPDYSTPLEGKYFLRNIDELDIRRL